MNLVTPTLALFLSLIVSCPVFARDDCPDTNIVLRLRISTKTLQDTLNRDTPNQMSGREGIDISGVKGEHVWWSMSRSPINLTASNNRLRANTTISGKVRVRGKVRPFGPDFSVGPDLTVGANLSIRPVLESDWRLHPNIKASARVTSARIDTPVGSISVRTQSQRAVDKLMRRTVDRINEKFEKNASLRREGQKLWKKLHRVERLSEEPPIWLVMEPIQIKATNLSIKDDGVSIKDDGVSIKDDGVSIKDDGVNFRISVTVKTEINFGDKPPSPTQKELPPLEISDKLPEGKIELALPVFSDWETLNGLIADSLAKNPVVHEGSSGLLALTNVKLAAVPEESVLVSAAISAKPTEWVGRMLRSIQDGLQAVGLHFSLIKVLDNQIVEISVKPTISKNGKSIVLKSAKLMPDSSDLVKTLAGTYSWLTDETIEAVIERHAVADLSTRLAELEQKGQTIVNKFTEKLEESGFSLSVEIQPVTRFSFVEVHPEGLVAKVCAAADTKADIRSFDF